MTSKDSSHNLFGIKEISDAAREIHSPNLYTKNNGQIYINNKGVQELAEYLVQDISFGFFYEPFLRDTIRKYACFNCILFEYDTVPQIVEPSDSPGIIYGTIARFAKYLGMLSLLGLAGGCLSQSQPITEEEKYMKEYGIQKDSAVWKKIKEFDTNDDINSFEKSMIGIATNEPEYINHAIIGYEFLPKEDQKEILMGATENDILKLVLYGEAKPEFKEMMLLHGLSENIREEIKEPTPKFIEVYDTSKNGRIDNDELDKILYENSQLIDSTLWEDIKTHLKIYEKYGDELYPDLFGKDLGEIVEYFLDTYGNVHPKIPIYLEESLFDKTLEPEEQEKIDIFFRNEEIISILGKLSPDSMIQSVINKYSPSLELTPEQIKELEWLNLFTDNSLQKQNFPTDYLPSNRSDILEQFNFYIVPMGNENYAVFIAKTPYGMIAMADWYADGTIDSIFVREDEMTPDTTLADFIYKSEHSILSSTYKEIIFYPVKVGNNYLFHQELIGGEWWKMTSINYSFTDNYTGIVIKHKKDGADLRMTAQYFPDGWYWKSKDITYKYLIEIDFQNRYDGRELYKFYDENGIPLYLKWGFGDEGSETDADNEKIFDKYGKWLELLLFGSNGDNYLKWLREYRVHIYDPLNPNPV